jgi:hypothetical protein
MEGKPSLGRSVTICLETHSEGRNAILTGVNVYKGANKMGDITVSFVASSGTTNTSSTSGSFLHLSLLRASNNE